MRALIFMLIAAIASITGGGVASASPPIVPGPNLFVESGIVPDLTNCEDANDLPMRMSCSAGMVNNILAELDAPLPNYALVHNLAVGITQLEIDSRDGSIVACGYASGIMENHYCDGTIHLGESNLEVLQTYTADPLLGIALVTAHEAGHFIQNKIGGVNLTPIFMDERVFPYEQWSDCFAGFALRTWIDEDIFPQNSEQDALNLMYNIGREGEKSHGSGEQRQAAFAAGLSGRGSACGDPSVGYGR